MIFIIMSFIDVVNVFDMIVHFMTINKYVFSSSHFHGVHDLILKSQLSPF